MQIPSQIANWTVLFLQLVLLLVSSYYAWQCFKYCRKARDLLRQLAQTRRPVERKLPYGYDPDGDWNTVDLTVAVPRDIGTKPQQKINEQ